LFAKNIPGEITLPIDEIIKSRGADGEFSGEEIISSDQSLSDQNTIIVDNEDAGFTDQQAEHREQTQKTAGNTK
jgi:hypothetical protein